MFKSFLARRLKWVGDVAARGADCPEKFVGEVVVYPKKARFGTPVWEDYQEREHIVLNAVIVARNVDLEVVMSLASLRNIIAVVTAEGGVTTHGCTVAREIVAEQGGAHQVLIVGCGGGVHRRLKTGNRVQIELQENGQATVSRLD